MAVDSAEAAAARDGGARPEAAPDEEAWPSLQAAAVAILNTPCPFEKARRTDAAKRQWKAGGMPVVADDEGLQVPDAPARPSDVVSNLGKVKSGSMRAMLHGVCHAESYAIDLMWDSVARFARGDAELGQAPPREFFDQWVDIAHDESRHFRSWAGHLEEKYATRYGDLPTHDMLWEVAFATRHSLCARLAVVHLIHEARGMDVAPTMRAKCLRSQDPAAAAVLDANIADEVGHVRAGARWFKHFCGGVGERKPVDPREEFLRLARAHYVGGLKRPLNTELRRQAEIPEEWYLPLVEELEAALDALNASAGEGDEGALQAALDAAVALGAPRADLEPARKALAKLQQEAGAEAGAGDAPAPAPPAKTALAAA